MESIGNGGRRPHDQEIHVQGLCQLGGAERQTGMVQDTHLVGRQGQRPAAQHHRRSQRDRQHAQREHHRTGERLREGGAVRHHPAREQQRRHGRRHRAQQTGRQDPGVLLPVERRIPADVARPLAGLHQFQRQFPETHAAGDDDQRPRQKTAEQRQLLGLLLPDADAPHEGRRRDDARRKPRGRKGKGVRLRHRGPDGREVCGRQQPTYGRIRAGRHGGLPGLPSFAARDRHQPVVRNDDLVAARNFLGVFALLLGRRQRTLPCEDRKDVLVGRCGVHVEPCRAEDEVDLLLERARVFLCLGTHDVRGADDDFVVPRHGEQHAAVRGLGNHDCVVALQELHVEYDMHALTRRHHSAVCRAVHVHDVVHEAAGGVYDAARFERVLLAGEVVHELHACGAARRVMHDARDGSLIDDRAAVFDAGLREVHGHTRVVELSVVVHHAAFQSLLDRSRDVFHYLFRRNVNVFNLIDV